MDGLESVVKEFLDSHEPRAFNEPSWFHELPSGVCKLYRMVMTWDGMIERIPDGYGAQDSLNVPPALSDDAEWRIITENQGGFSFCIKRTANGWTGTVKTDRENRCVPSIDGYLVSFALQEMILSAPLWATDEGMEGHADSMKEDLTLLWNDQTNGGYFGDENVRFYRHRCGALVMCDDRGLGDIGCQDMNRREYFENLGFYDLR